MIYCNQECNIKEKYFKNFQSMRKSNFVSYFTLSHTLWYIKDLGNLSQETDLNSPLELFFTI